MATKGTVSGVIANMVTLVVDGPVSQNEICYISTGGDKLMAEVIKVVGANVYVQVFESTRGLKVGAEAYIEKPFSYDYLKAQILSLLNNRQKEREAFSKRPFFPVQNMQMSKEDEEFMNKVIEVINANLKDETFNVERMAEELCLSRSSLLRKIKTLFNLSPIDFIRLIRLKKAAELIQDGKYRVGEICYMVGFSSHSYFSKLFFKQFGMTPKDFEKQISNTRSKVRNSQEINIEDLIQGNKTNS